MKLDLLLMLACGPGCRMKYASLWGVAAVIFLFSACGGRTEVEDEVRVDSTDTRAHDLASLIQGKDELTRFTRALELTGIKEMLRMEGPFTVFAPSNEAFRQTSFFNDSLFINEYSDSLRLIIEHHLMRGRLTPEQVTESLKVSTLSNEMVTIHRRVADQPLWIDGVPVRESIPAQNGVLFILGSVLTLPDTTDQASQDAAGTG